MEGESDRIKFVTGIQNYDIRQLYACVYVIDL